jgi:class 3 adenylate cyclase/tetratricopeptide (TPR) repeat protein
MEPTTKPVPTAKESERRTATVLFADISGFTAMSEKIDPEELTAIVNDCFSRMGRVIELKGGTIDKFMGDCIMVLFGVPQAIEDAPQKAVDCAIEMRSALQEFSEERALETPLDLHVGINSGELIYGEIGSEQKKQYTVMGDIVNVASRLEDASDRGQILVGVPTYRATAGDFEYRELRPVTVRGKSEPVPVYELLAARSKGRIELAMTERMIHSDMIGRDQELERLKALVVRVIEGEGAIVSVIGDAGIGKTRLVRELRASELMSKLTLLEGRTQSLGQNLSFHLLADLIRHWAGIEEEDEEPEQVRKLTRLVNEANPREFAEIFPFLCLMLGIEPPGVHQERVRGVEAEGLSRLILKALRGLLLGATEQAPVVIRLEDLHWSDQSSIDLLLPLLRLVYRHRILFILVFRPKYAETSERVLSFLQENFIEEATTVALRPLDENQSKTLVSNLLKNRELPRRILSQIVEKSEGNPFFIEEVVRSLIDEGAVDVRRNRFAITDKIETVVIPDTINQVIMARIDRLEEETRNLLKIASVIGRTFLYRVLAEVAGAVGNLETRIAHLKGAEILLERRTREEREYLFRQALAHEAVYGSILFQKRKELHRSVARAIEKLFVQRLAEFYGMLAYHYSQGEDLDKAEEYLLNAGQLALKSSASSEALNYYNRALSLYLSKSEREADPHKLSMMARNIALAYSNKGYYAEAVTHFDRALQYLGERKGPSGLLGFLGAGLGILAVARTLRAPAHKPRAAPTERDNEILNLYFRRGWALSVVDPQRFFFDSIIALKRLTRFDLARVENGVSILAGACALFIFTGMFFGLSRRILEHLKGSIRPEDAKATLLHTYYDLLLRLLTGGWEHRFAEELIEPNLRTGDLQTVNFYLLACGLIAIERGAFAEAGVMIERLRQIGESYDNEGSITLSLELAAKMALKMRRPEEALGPAGEAIALSQKAGTRPVLVYYLGLKAQAELLAGRTEAAEASLAQAREVVAQAGVLVPHHRIRYAVAQASYDLFRLEQALAQPDRTAGRRLLPIAGKSVRQVVALSAKAAYDRTEAARLMACWLWLQGRRSEAMEWYLRSLRQAERLGARVELALSFEEIARRLAEAGGRPAELNGLTEAQYRELAHTLRQEMGLG